MFANLACTVCGHCFTVRQEQMGQRVVCPSCNTPFVAGDVAATLAGPTSPTPLKEHVAAQPGVTDETRTILAPLQEPIRHSCPRCKKSLEAPPGMAGQKLNCPACGQRLQIPQPAADANRTLLGSRADSKPSSSPPPLAPPPVPPPLPLHAELIAPGTRREQAEVAAVNGEVAVMINRARLRLEPGWRGREASGPRGQREKMIWSLARECKSFPARRLRFNPDLGAHRLSVPYPPSAGLCICLLSSSGIVSRRLLATWN